MPTWILLSYKIPREPSAGRVGVWRRLKRLGALLLHDAVWVLPDTPRTREQFQWLAAEVAELGGTASTWEAKALLGIQDDALVKQFTQQVDLVYGQILSGLETEDLATLSKKYQQASAQDYFHSELGKQVRERLERKGGD